MQFITVRDFRNSSAAIWKRLPKEREMVITNNGKPIALLTPITDRNLEETLSAIKQAMAIQAVRQMQEISVQLGNDKMSLNEINQEIAMARKERKNASCD